MGDILNSKENPENNDAVGSGAGSGTQSHDPYGRVAEAPETPAPRELIEDERLEFSRERAAKLSRIQRESYGWGKEPGSADASAGSGGRLVVFLGALVLLWLLYDKFFR